MATEINQATHGYVAKFPCGHAFGLTVDDPEHPKWTQSSIRDFLKTPGAYIERKTLDECRAADIFTRCEKCQPTKPPKGDGLFK